MGEEKVSFIMSKRESDAFFLLAVESGDLSRLSRGDKLFFTDLLGRKRVFYVEEKLTDEKVKISLEKSAYLSSETKLTLEEEGSFVIQLGQNRPEPARTSRHSCQSR